MGLTGRRRNPPALTSRSKLSTFGVYWKRSDRKVTAERIDRRSPQGLARYATEELVAELGAVFVSAMLGSDYEQRTDDNHASYRAHWLQMLKADASLLWKSATKASTAAEHVADVARQNRPTIAAISQAA